MKKILIWFSHSFTHESAYLKRISAETWFYTNKAIQKLSKGCKGQYLYIGKKVGNSNIFFYLVQSLKILFLWKTFTVYYLSSSSSSVPKSSSITNPSEGSISTADISTTDLECMKKKSRKAELNEFCRYRQGM